MSSAGAALAVLVAVGVAALAVALPSRGRPARAPAATSPAARFPLEGNGIGAIRFGTSPPIVATGLARLLGRPATAAAGTANGVVKSICGFGGQIYWTGLANGPGGSPSVGLTIYFRRGRFVGYAYGPPYADEYVPVVRSGPELATARGLTLNAPLAHARRLYGAAFIVGTQAQGTPPQRRLMRLAAWRVTTADGRLYGFIESPQDRGATRGPRRIGSISAGAIPNTPCRVAH